MFTQYNQEFIARLCAQRQRVIGAGATGQVRAYMAALGAQHPILPAPLLLERATFETLAGAANLLLSAQQKLIGHLLATRSRAALLRQFRVPPRMAQFIDWDKLAACGNTIARMDIIPTDSGYVFCEFNVHPAVGGGETYECAELYGAALDWPPVEGNCAPFYSLALLLTRMAGQARARRIVILDCLAHKGQGYAQLRALQQYCADLNPEREVHLCDEESYRAAWFAPGEAERTLIHRIFTYDDQSDDSAFVERLWHSGANVAHTFEAELRMSKHWFSLLCDARHHALFSEAEVDAILRYLPHTFDLDEASLAHALEHKDDYVFKQNYGYGGVGVLMGSDHGRAALERSVRAAGLANWSCQRYFPAARMDLPYNAALDTAQHQLVLGLYLYDGVPNGMFVRASRNSKVVNMAGGAASMTWAHVVDPAAKARLLAAVA